MNIDTIIQWLEGKKTIFCGIGLALSLVGVAACFYLKLIDMSQAVVFISTFVGIFGGGGAIFQRQATAKLEKVISNSVEDKKQ